MRKKTSLNGRLLAVLVVSLMFGLSLTSGLPDLTGNGSEDSLPKDDGSIKPEVEIGGVERSRELN